MYGYLFFGYTAVPLTILIRGADDEDSNNADVGCDNNAGFNAVVCTCNNAVDSMRRIKDALRTRQPFTLICVRFFCFAGLRWSMMMFDWPMIDLLKTARSVLVLS
mmetsp:Transcript_8148/g.12090  ORF Transcript_8148/g.12090 Transcript_8148/m.12090 type:complete len:105 (-) Transcript_8148:275-589(-)